MIDVTLTFNGYNFSPLLSTYRCYHSTEVSESVVTIDGTEYVASNERPVVEFSLIPLSDAQSQTVYQALSAITANAVYTDPYRGESSGVMRVSSNLDATFGLRSIDGNRYYKGGVIVLRQRTVI
jgi:hypothetical protein